MIIETKNGLLEALEEKDCYLFKGVEYALSSRFSSPHFPLPWSGIKKANKSYMMTQRREDEDSFYKKEFYFDDSLRPEEGENKLCLDIWTPKEKGCYPVLVFFHGGAFIKGYSSEIEFSGSEYAKRGVIMVSVNYRLGIFGYLPLSKRECNYGLQDQAMALGWVKDNISSFCGDSSRISIMGQSAGALSILALLSSSLLPIKPYTVILLSSGGLDGPLPFLRGNSEEIALASIEFFKNKGLNRDDLFSLSSYALLSYEEELISYLNSRFPSLVFPLSPLFDNETVFSTSFSLESGKYDNFPLLMSSVLQDLTERPEGKEKNEMLNSTSRFLSKRKGPSYSMFFTHPIKPDYIAPFHSSELWFVFGTLKRSWRNFDFEDYELSSFLLDAFSSFVSTTKLPWPEFPYIKEIE